MNDAGSEGVPHGTALPNPAKQGKTMKGDKRRTRDNPPKITRFTPPMRPRSGKADRHENGVVTLSDRSERT